MLQAALGRDQNLLAVALVLTSVLSAGYYLYVVMVMFMRPRPKDAQPVAPVPRLTGLVIGLTAGALLIFGVFPNPVLWFARQNTLPVPVPTMSQDMPGMIHGVAPGVAQPAAPPVAAIPTR